MATTQIIAFILMPNVMGLIMYSLRSLGPNLYLPELPVAAKLMFGGWLMALFWILRGIRWFPGAFRRAWWCATDRSGIYGEE